MEQAPIKDHLPTPLVRNKACVINKIPYFGEMKSVVLGILATKGNRNMVSSQMSTARVAAVGGALSLGKLQVP